MAGARLVILDEPTSVLAPQEVDALFAGHRRPAGRRAVGGDHHPQAERGPRPSPTGSRCCGAASWSSATPTRPPLDRRRAGRGHGRARRAAAAGRAGRRPTAERPAGARACDGRLGHGTRRHGPARGRRPRRRAPASWSASPAWPATASGSCTRWPSGCWRPPRARLVDRRARRWRRPGPRRRSRRRRRGRARGPDHRRRRARPVGRRARRPRRPARFRKGLGIDWAAVRRDLAELDERTGLRVAAGHRMVGDAVGRQHPAGHAGPGAGRPGQRWSSPPTPAGASTSPRPGAPRSCCSSSGPTAPACC